MAIANGIEEILGNPAKAKEFTEKAYQYVKEDHSLKKVTQGYIQAFEKLLGRK
jgi:glycosyltransferase involved in cell wall biosynthesis